MKSKALWRASLLAARRSVPAEVRAAEAEQLARHLRALAVPGATVCGYVPVGTEPGSVSLLDELREAGMRVLLPITAPDQPLSWAEYVPGALVAARFGLLEPTGDRLPPETIAEADLVIVPALAVDRRGVRLGRGAGYYDRTLGWRAAGARVVAVVRDSEWVDVLPADEHDIAMTHVVTPNRGVVPI